MTKKVCIILATVVLSLGLINPARAYVMLVYQEKENVSLDPGLGFYIPEVFNPPPVVTTSNSSGNYFVNQTVDIRMGELTLGQGNASVSFNASVGPESTTFSLVLSGDIYGPGYAHHLYPSGNVSVLFSIAKEPGDLQDTVPVGLEAGLLPGYRIASHANTPEPIGGSASGPGCGVQGACPAPFSWFPNPPNPTYDSEIVNLNVGDFYTLDLSLTGGFPGGNFGMSSLHTTGDVYVTVDLPAIFVPPYAATPLPSTVLLFGSGLLGLAGWRGFRKG